MLKSYSPQNVNFFKHIIPLLYLGRGGGGWLKWEENFPNVYDIRFCHTDLAQPFVFWTSCIFFLGGGGLIKMGRKFYTQYFPQCVQY